jgi:pimeloyl-ACP methyl ester carboxylesterase
MTSARHRSRTPLPLLLWGGALLAALAAGAAYTASSTAQINRRHAPQGRFAVVDGVRLHVLEAGAGSGVLLIHGNAVTAEDWRASGVFQALAQHHRVLAVDRPGCGHSARPRDRLWTPAVQARLLARLLEQEEVGPVVVAAHSLGVQVAVRLALARPDLVRGLVLVSGYYFPSLRLDSVLAGLHALPGAGWLWRWSLGPPLGRALSGLMLGLMFGPQQPPKGYRRGLFELGLRPLQLRATTADGAYMLAEALQSAGLLSGLRTPVHVLAGRGDRIVRPGPQSERLGGAAPGARYEEIEAAGHMLHHAAPQRVAAAVQALAV